MRVFGVFEYSLLLIFPAAMAFAAMLDLFTMTIPNKISLTLLACFLVVAPLTGMSWEQFFIHLGIGIAVLAVSIVLFALGALGGGDAKLLAAASLWIGYNDLLIYLIHAALIGAVLAIAIVIYRGMLPPLWALKKDWAMRLYNKKEGIPYGIALAGGALLTFPSTPWFLSVAA